MSETRTLKLFSSDYEVASAYDLDDLRKWFVEDQGMIENDDFNPNNWEELTMDQPLVLAWDKHQWESLPESQKPANAEVVEVSDVGGGHYVVSAIGTDWIASNARGVIWSTEY